MTRKTIISMLAVALVCIFFLPAFSQEDIKQLADPAFEQPQRPAVPFMHDEHNEKAGLDGCLPCHHEGKENGELVEGDPVPCAECHSVEGDGDVLPLMLAYHKQCGDCHAAEKKGPLACGECHQR
ncbi:acidic tetraheme cytochrome c3 TmcA [Pseudodesulfovibrio tunisiensis]|uniref:acidic tetraheme cytochrome c3 TmcA n=1 Tax=Pseudodesulfovibrio tunisiensis TaxID=463192 RepID=UPI001FB30347|nr:cytochrome c3 family protein [Pseudodesulfovibrio tunisiensis]